MSKFNILLILILFLIIFWAQPDSASERTLSMGTNSSPTPTAIPTPTPTIPLPRNFSIPKISVNAPVIPVGIDASGKMMLPENINEVGWYSLGAKPGEAGNAVIAGHLDSASGEGAIFYRLRELESGDQLFITDEFGKQYTFVVTSKVIYEFDKVPLEEVFGNTGKKRLNLITCTGWFNQIARNYSHRMIIYSELVE